MICVHIFDLSMIFFRIGTEQLSKCHVLCFSDSVASTLQDEMGLPVSSSTFTNWAGTIRRDVVYVVRPSTIEHVQQIVRVARKHGLKVRAGGSTLSWSPLFPDEDQVLVDMSIFQAQDEERMVVQHAVSCSSFFLCLPAIYSPAL